MQKIEWVKNLAQKAHIYATQGETKTNFCTQRLQVCNEMHLTAKKMGFWIFSLLRGLS